jgi:hypothetical protein
VQTLTLAALVVVTLCGSPNYRMREAAGGRLKLASEVCPGVVLAGEKSNDAEIRERCRQTMGRWFARHADELANAQGKLPRIDNAPGLSDWESGGRFEEFACYIKDAGGSVHYMASKYDCNYWWNTGENVCREATRLWLRDRIAARVPWRDQLEEIARNERAVK